MATVKYTKHYYIEVKINFRLATLNQHFLTIGDAACLNL